MSWSDAVILENAVARLKPLTLAHRDELAEAVAVGELWKTWYAPSIPSPEGMADAISELLVRNSEGTAVAWAVLDAKAGRAIGMTTFLNLDSVNRRLEIGSTWLSKTAQGTGINPAAKLLLLERAFDVLGCIAVEFRTHWHNHQSRAAIAKLGAKQDGVLRNHKVLPNGTIRDTVVFSIIDAEWPTVRQTLSERMLKA
ncbi:Protein N-acetyltransferase, RimJ/RimL family [Tessaracoccus bendigoensis DSM 12906]|uniref:Protein N-acetyltransferase, RimJ/RimL family n=1 Tax=Tessaracoccus bendigoensis DSM 12906 TaxID=1123357 RepID=A0A1M6J939_9ACTN|nr:GNAT family protein [Tessaracoccus bendigoensis]SHJ43207.1 Protein N-acetyltransferase, RimJ/RimL family [Tessaracoccus bendigoensis DSM 12906]